MDYVVYIMNKVVGKILTAPMRVVEAGITFKYCRGLDGKFLSRDVVFARACCL